MSAGVPAVYTVGHSVHTAEALINLLKAHAIGHLADVRLIPGSRRHPHFSREALPALLEPAGVSYLHFPDLGGRRRPRPDSVNTAWRVEAFRGYADYMASQPFRDSLEALLELSRTGATASCAPRRSGGNATAGCWPTRWLSGEFPFCTSSRRPIPSPMNSRAHLRRVEQPLSPIENSVVPGRRHRSLASSPHFRTFRNRRNQNR